jgi:hypothetical protein
VSASPDDLAATIGPALRRYLTGEIRVRMLGWARAAGFDEIEVSASSWCYATPDDRSWWGGLWAERVTQSNFADQAISFACSVRV